ncbi:unnamed protein product [Gadus morhua 'NCC']
MHQINLRSDSCSVFDCKAKKAKKDDGTSVTRPPSSTSNSLSASDRDSAGSLANKITDELAVSDAEANDGSDSDGSDTADLPTEFGTSEPEPVKTGSDRPASQANPPCHQGEPAVRHQTALKVKTGSDRPASQANPPCHQGEPAVRHQTALHEKILAKNMGPGERQRRTPTPGRRLGPFRGIAASDSRPAPQEGSDQRHGECEGPDRPPRKDLSQVMGNVRIRVKGLRKQRVETLTTALPDLEEVKPLDRLSRRNPFRRIKMAWAETKAVIATTPPRTALNSKIWSLRLGRMGKPHSRLRGRASGLGSTSG